MHLSKCQEKIKSHKFTSLPSRSSPKSCVPKFMNKTYSGLQNQNPEPR